MVIVSIAGASFIQPEGFSNTTIPFAGIIPRPESDLGGCDISVIVHPVRLIGFDVILKSSIHSVVAWEINSSIITSPGDAATAGFATKKPLVTSTAATTEKTFNPLEIFVSLRDEIQLLFM